MKKAFIFFITASIVFFSCGGEEVKPRLPVGENIEDVPNFVMEGFRLTSTKDGEEKWILTGRGAQIFEMKNKAFVQDVKMESFDEKGRVTVLTGDRADVDTETNFMKVTGDVRVAAPNGMVLKTEELYWDEKKQKIYNNAFVTIIKDNNKIHGIGFESGASMENMRIKKRVRLRAKDIKNE